MHWKSITVVASIVLLAVTVGAAETVTPWERDPEATPRYAETVTWCEQLAQDQDTVAFRSFGTSPQGRKLPLVIWDAGGLQTPAAAEAAGRVVLLVQACIHAGESCGKDAGMTLVRDLAEQGGPRGVTLLFVPIFNVDGHERFGPYNRINQNGPREMGWRVTAQNLNLNRDFAKADAPEMRAWLDLWNRWQPHFLVDIHSTDGADYQYAITYGLELGGNLDPDLTDWLSRYLAAVESPMAADGFPLAPYVSFRNWHDPRSGLVSWVAGPRFSQGYAAVRNRPGLLIETHMLKPYPVRVRAARALLDHTLAYLSAHADGLRGLADAADRRAASAAWRAEPLPVRWQRNTEESEPYSFLGVAYEPHTSPLSGGEYMVYDAGRPETFEVEYFRRARVAATVSLPEAYLIPPQWDAVIDRLVLHGVKLERLREAVTLDVESWRLRDCCWPERPYEGRHQVDYTADEVVETRTYPAGTVVVDTAQPAARLLAHLLDPAGPDALLRWGFFDAALTRVEYVESYVIEALMAEMVAAQPALADSLEARKAADPEFAADPWAIRDWFYRQTPYYDAQAFLYPVGCLRDRSNLKKLDRNPGF